MNLPEAIHHARKELGLSQAGLARIAGMRPHQISALEKGRNITLTTLRKVLRRLPNLQTFTFETVQVTVRRPPQSALRRRIVAFLSRLVAALR